MVQGSRSRPPDHIDREIHFLLNHSIEEDPGEGSLRAARFPTPSGYATTGTGNGVAPWWRCSQCRYASLARATSR